MSVINDTISLFTYSVPTGETLFGIDLCEKLAGYVRQTKNDWRITSWTISEQRLRLAWMKYDVLTR